LSLPKTGSDGWGYTAATALGHSIVPTTPALAPLLIDSTADRSIHARLSGVSMPVRLDVRVDGSVSTRLDGAMLWTHFGVSGPVAMDASRHWLRARLEGRDVQLTARLCPGETFESLEREWVEAVRDRPRGTTLARLTREDRRRLIHALLEWPLAVVDSRGYNYAEATAGGVPLDEIDPSTMASRLCPGLFLVGEILDVDGRIGGFNFQWAWSSARVAGQALARRRAAGASEVPLAGE
jgi:predicted flavoprotein YhiN